MKRNRRQVIQYNAPTTLNFAILSFVVLVIGIATRGASTMKLFCCIGHSPLTDIITYPRFLTHVLGHSSFSHYAGNITLMLVLGPGLEERYGSGTMLKAMVITAAVSGFLHWLLFPGVALLGASGIVFMMILMASLGGMRSGGIPLTLILVFVIYVGGEVVSGISNADNISHLTHIVGGIVGAALGVGLRQGKA